ncbi:MAG TPA: ATP-binding protein, partial [Leptolinea sp.]
LPARISFPLQVDPPANFSIDLKPAEPHQILNPHPLIPAQSDGFHWAVPLQSSRGLEGWLFIGERKNGGFYRMEEIKIARAAAERLMDIQTAAEVAHRLVVLQRKQQIETRLLDQKARQVLHDEILPLLHTALLTDPKSPAAGQITLAHQQISQLLREAPPPPPAEIASKGLFAALKKIAQDEADFLQANLIFEIDLRVEAAGMLLAAEAAETVFYAVRECLRNIQRHTLIEEGKPIKISISASLNGVLQIIIENNGAASDVNEEDQPVSSGQGLALHNALLTAFGGGLRMEHLENEITRVSISLPISTIHAPD